MLSPAHSPQLFTFGRPVASTPCALGADSMYLCEKTVWGGGGGLAKSIALLTLPGVGACISAILSKPKPKSCGPPADALHAHYSRSAPGQWCPLALSPRLSLVFPNFWLASAWCGAFVANFCDPAPAKPSFFMPPLALPPQSSTPLAVQSMVVHESKIATAPPCSC